MVAVLSSKRRRRRKRKRRSGATRMHSRRRLPCSRNHPSILGEHAVALQQARTTLSILHTPLYGCSRILHSGRNSVTPAPILSPVGEASLEVPSIPQSSGKVLQRHEFSCQPAVIVILYGDREQTFNATAEWSLGCRHKRKRKVPQPDYDEEEQQYSAAPDAEEPPPIKAVQLQRWATKSASSTTQPFSLPQYCRLLMGAYKCV